jgi:ankyrin repeat protein
LKTRLVLTDELRELSRLVREGRLFAVQDWLAAKKPVSAPKPTWHTPLRVAVKSGFHSMVELFLQQGVDQHELDYLLDHTVFHRQLPLVELLIQHGANPLAINFGGVLGSGHIPLIRFFLEHGADAETGHPFAHALTRPHRGLLRIYLDYRSRIPSFELQLNLALRHHARAGNLKWVSLLLWAGGNSRLKLPDVGEDPDPDLDSTALEEAVRTGRVDIAQYIGFRAEDDLDALMEFACRSGRLEMVDLLLALGAHPCGKNRSERPINLAIEMLSWKFGDSLLYLPKSDIAQDLTLISRLAELGARWRPDPDMLRYFRRDLAREEGSQIARIIRSFHDHNVCEPSVLLDLINTRKLKDSLQHLYPRLETLLKRAAANNRSAPSTPS